MRDRRQHALQPQHRQRTAGACRLARSRCAPPPRPAGGPRRRRRTTSPWPRPTPDGRGVVEAEHQNRRLGLRARQRLDGHLGRYRQRPPGARHQLAEVVPCDVLHHAAAGLEGLAPPRHRRKSKEVVARGSGLDPARTGHVGGEHTADGAAPGGAAEQRAVVHGLEGQLLVLRGDQRLNFGDRRAGLGGQHQFFRLVERHARERGEVERQVGLCGPADGAL